MREYKTWHVRERLEPLNKLAENEISQVSVPLQTTKMRKLTNLIDKFEMFCYNNNGDVEMVGTQDSGETSPGHGHSSVCKDCGTSEN